MWSSLTYLSLAPQYELALRSSRVLPRLVYQHLPPSQRERDQAAARHRPPPKSYRTRNFYQVKRIDEILFAVPIFPVDVWDIEQPEQFRVCEHGWGM